MKNKFGRKLKSFVLSFLRSKLILEGELGVNQKTFYAEKPSILTKDEKLAWSENGYLVLKSFISKSRIKQVNDLVDSIWKNRNAFDTPLVIDVLIGTSEEKRIKLKDATDQMREHPYKLNDLFLEYDLIQEIILDLELSDIIREFLGGDPLVCNSLTFEYGSQQRPHFDTFYMPPPETNKMVASWVALDETTSENGPLIYYPKSHLVPPYLFSHGKTNAISEEMEDFDQYINKELKERSLKPEKFFAEAGDVFIWHAQLYHGGDGIINNEAKRRSLVTHYYSMNNFVRDEQIHLGHNRYIMNRDHQKT